MLSETFLSEEQKLLDQLDDILTRLKKAGADEAEAVIGESISFDLQCRHGQIIDTDHAEGRDVVLRVFIGKRQAGVSVSLDSLQDVDELAARVVSMAKATPEDPYCGLAAETIKITKNAGQDLDLYDTKIPRLDDLKANILAMEELALAQKDITNSEGAQAGWSLSQIAHMTSGGFYGAQKTSGYGLSCAVLAEKNGAMERDYAFCSAHHVEDMEAPHKIAMEAATRAAARLGAQKPKSCTAAVIYDPRVARSLLGHFAAAISGAAVARGSSFLKDDLGKIIFPEAIDIIDDPFRVRGLRSQLFDSEGVGGQKRRLIDQGRLTSWLMDWPSARQLSLASTGHAAAAPGSVPSPSPTNLWIAPGAASPEELIGEIDHGLYVTELIGSGVNPVTGDYSRGAVGFWVQKGKITHPVNEITIVGNLKSMFADLTVGNDLLLRYGVDTPTLKVAQMTIAGA